MRSDPTYTTWGTVRPKLDKELEQIKEALVAAKIEDVPSLQSRAQALQSVREWFEAGAPDHKPMISEDSHY